MITITDKAALILLAGIAIVFLLTWILQLLWNSTLPELFGFKRISFWTAFKLGLISPILFGGGMKLPLGVSGSEIDYDTGAKIDGSFGASTK